MSSKKIYDGKTTILNAWGDFPPERLNQRVSRLLLSDHKKSSWLAVLGDFGRYPLLINSLTHTFNYHRWIKNKVNKNSLIAQTFCEMNNFKEGGNWWLSKIEKLKKQLGIREVRSFWSRSAVNEQYKKSTQSKFDRYWLDEVKKI